MRNIQSSQHHSRARAGLIGLVGALARQYAEEESKSELGYALTELPETRAVKAATGRRETAHQTSVTSRTLSKCKTFTTAMVLLFLYPKGP